jgi:ribosomal protection tetracycline resistance protein
MKKINIGIVAHVDAGKTTTTENLLYYSGIIKEVGRVDSGNTQTDSMELERRRGITIRASAISFNWREVKVNLLDTPGHVDFVSEVERSLSVLDGAILLISAVEGIQSQTRILFNTLKALKIPTLIFINKLDRAGANSNKVFDEIKDKISDKVVRLQEIYKEGTKEVSVSPLLNSDIIKDNVMNLLADTDETFLEEYLQGIKHSDYELRKRLSFFSRKGSVYPIFCGAAATGLGIENLLDGICEFLPTYEGDGSGALSAVVFKIERTNVDEKKVYVRLFQGKISVRDIIELPNNIVGKVKKINVLDSGKFIDTSVIYTGDIGVIYGLSSIKIGDIIGSSNDKIKKISIAKPTFKTTIAAVNKEENSKLFKALTLLTEEDPLLEVETNDIEKGIYVNLFGEVQMEILKSILEESYGIAVEFSNIITIYTETPKGIGNALARMQEKLNPFFATVGLRVEPTERGQGLIYTSNVSIGSLPKSFQNAIEEAVISTCKQGLFGWEVTDIKVTLTCGEFSSPTSTPADFRNTTPMVLMEALNEAKTNILEPLHEFELRIPQNVLSKAIWDLQNMRAVFQNPIIKEEEFLIKGLIPVENSKEYNMKIASYTEGKGMFMTKFYGYEEVPLELAKIREKSGYDPLNKKEYLLHKLNAIRD